MNRSEKQELVSVLRSDFSGSTGAFLVNYKGMSVAQVEKLRTQLRGLDAHFRVAKARLMRIAVEELDGGVKEFGSNFEGQVGLVFSHGDVARIAKKLFDYAREVNALSVVSSVFENRVWNAEQTKAIANLPSREVLLTQLAISLNASIAGLARVLNKVAEAKQA